MDKYKTKVEGKYSFKGKKPKIGKPGEGAMFIQLKSLKSLLGLKNGGDTMLKGRQKNLDKNKDGKITGEDFKMMKAKYGKMMKAKKGVMVTGKKEEDEYSKYVKSIKLPDAKDVRDVVKNKSMGGEMKKPMKAALGAIALGAVGAKAAKKLMEKKASAVSPAMNYLGDTAKKSKGGEMKSTQGYGAARTSGMGLQDEDLIPGKSMDYYKDLM